MEISTKWLPTYLDLVPFFDSKVFSRIKKFTPYDILIKYNII